VNAGNVGIIGCGAIGKKRADSLGSAVKLVACADTQLARAQALAGKSGARATEDWRAVVTAPDVDIVVIATPHDALAPITLAAVQAGKHVLVEKPMSITAGEAQRMVDACDAADVRLAVVSQHRWRDAPVAAKEVVASGRLGRIRMARVESTAAGWWDLEARQDQWKKDPAKQTAFSSDAAHGNDILRWLLGSEATRAYSQWTSYSGFVPGESNMTIYTWANGVLSDYWMSYELPEPGLGSMNFLLTGSDAMLRFDVYGKVEVSQPDGSWELVFEQQAFDPLNAVDRRRLRAYAAQVEDLLAAIAEHRDPFVSGREGRHTMDMLEGADRSAKLNQAVDLPLA
jgi:predicted dehydrogenase